MWAGLICAHYFRAPKHQGLNFPGQTNRIENSFSLELNSGFYFYGLKNEDQIIVLGLDAYNIPSEDEVKKMGNFLTKNALQLVDWCRCISVDEESGLGGVFKR